MQENRAHLIVIGFGDIEEEDRQGLNKMIKATNDGSILMNPNTLKIKELFAEISNYKFTATPLILETFN